MKTLLHFFSIPVASQRKAQSYRLLPTPDCLPHAVVLEKSAKATPAFQEHPFARLRALLAASAWMLADVGIEAAEPIIGKPAVAELRAKGQFDSLAAAFVAAQYAVKPVDIARTVPPSPPSPNPAPPPGTSGWAQNPAQGLNCTFTPEGLTFTVRTGSNVDAPVHTVGWRLRSLGYGAAQTHVPAGALHTTGQCVELARPAPAVTEWFQNKPAGLEHGFTLPERPMGVPSAEPLRLVLAVTGDLMPQADATSQSLALRDEAGRTVLTYAKLKVWDALGTEFQSTLQASQGQVILEVADKGAIYPLTIDPTFAQQAYLKASNTDSNDFFGSAIAISGDTVVVGAPYESSSATGVSGDGSDNNAPSSGAAYVFVRNGRSWTQQAYLKASNAEPGDWFGASVSVSGDTILVGAPYESSSATGVNGDAGDNSAGASGAAYVFVRSGTNWTQQAYLKASNPESGDFFGNSVSLSSNTVVVGAAYESSSATGVNGDGNDNSAAASGAAYVFVRSGTNWTQQAYLKASNTETNDQFGLAVAISGDTVVVGAPNESSSATGVNGNGSDDSAAASGAAYVFARSGTNWTQQAYLKASNAWQHNQFGSSVSASGGTLVVGSPGESSSATGVNGNGGDTSVGYSGAAYVFERSGTNWTQQAYLKASNTDYGDGFGSSVAISGDRVVVGSPSEASDATGVNGDGNDNSAYYSGAAYLFVRNGTNWTQQAYLKAGNAEVWDEFGYAVAVSVDTVVVGAIAQSSSATGVNVSPCTGNDNNAVNSGAAYVFDLNDLGAPQIAIEQPVGNSLSNGSAQVEFLLTGANAVTAQRTFTVRNTGNGDLTGLAVTITGPDADAFRVTTNPTRSVLGPCSHAEFTVTFSPHTTGPKTAHLQITSTDSPFDIVLTAQGVSPLQIAQQAYLKASNTDSNDWFGSAVAVSGDTVVVGAPFESSSATGVNGDGSDNSAPFSGAAYVFVRTGTNWTQQAYLKAGYALRYDQFGWSVSLSGNTLVVGSPESGSGLAYVFVRSGTNWTQQAYLKASNTESGDGFGSSVSVSSNTVVVGAYGESSNATGVNGDGTDTSAYQSGAAYVFVRSGTNWSQQAYLKASNTEAGDNFGSSVAASGDMVVVGAPYESSSATGVDGTQSDNSAPRSGAAYVFVRTGTNWTQQTYFKASNTYSEASFGSSVAMSGGTLVVEGGASYVFVQGGTNWTQQAFLRGGSSVAVSGDTLVVGTPYDSSSATGVTWGQGNSNDNSAESSGAAYVFVRSGTNWSQRGYLKASNTGRGDQFGFAVAVSGETVVTGSIEEGSGATGVGGDQCRNDAPSSGAAYVFDLAATVTFIGTPKIRVEQPLGSPLTNGSARVDFGVVGTNGGAVQRTFIIRNTGTADLTGFSVGITGPDVNAFRITGTPWPWLAALGSCGHDEVMVTFSPHSPGIKTARLRIFSNDRDASPFDIALSGTSISPLQIAQEAYLKASNTGSNDYFGVSVAVTGDTVVVGAVGESSSAIGVNGNDRNNSAVSSGAAYIFVRDGTNWTQQAYLKASNTEYFDGFGYAVAISGDTVVVGTPFESSSATGVNGNGNDNNAFQSGAAYVFVRSGTNWTQQAYLKANNTQLHDYFASSVAISGDTVVVGAGGESSSATGVNGNGSDNSAFQSGAAYVFVRSGTNWTQQAYLKASNTDQGDGFGSVAVSGDTIVVGAGGEDGSDNSAANSGAAYVFGRSGTNWTQQAYLKASNADQGDGFGGSVAISGDTVVVGAGAESSGATGVNGNGNDNSAAVSGAAYVFVRGGTNWTQQAYLKASNTAERAYFGFEVSVSGETVVIGASGEGGSNSDSLENTGAAYVFVRHGTNWTQQDYLKAGNRDRDDYFGMAVAVAGDTVVVGTDREASSATGVNGDGSDNSSPDSGAAYVFTVVSQISITLQPQSQTVVRGGDVTFSVSATGLPRLSYQWRFNGRDLFGATNSSYTLMNAQATNAGSYSVVVSHFPSTITSSNAALVVLIPTTILAQPQSQIVLEGGTATFFASALGTQPLSFHWLKAGFPVTNGIILYGADRSSLTLTNVQLNDAATYSAVATNLLGVSPPSSNAVLTVLADSDHDQLPDVWEIANGLNPNDPSDAGLDSDGDTVTNLQEYRANTNPHNSQSYPASRSHGIPEPTLTFYGVVTNQAGQRLTAGTLTWRFIPSPGDGSAPIVLTTQLTNINDQFSYLLRVPCESQIATLAVSSNTLKLVTPPVNYDRSQVLVDGIPASLVQTNLGTFTFSRSQRAQILRLDLQISLSNQRVDGNGLYLAWQLRHFGRLGINPSDDPDHDGMTNLQEMLAGTDPNDPQSGFAFIAIRTIPQVGTEVRWSSSAGRSYAIQRSRQLLTGFVDLLTGIAATEPINAYLDTNAVAAGPYFYRLRLELEP